MRKNDLEEAQWKDWICEQCDDKEIGLKLIDFIKTRIQVTEPEDNRSRFIFRELLQNADDVKANILVVRFEDDALYVANDGRAFTTGNKGDFAKISQVLGRHQAEDKDVVGHFGSGFQTVYAITNSPEVHSSGRSGRMNPYTNKWDYDFEGLFKKRDSPYLHKASKGVLFRFPWRDDARAREEIRGERVWEDRTYWPRWSKRERRELFEDLKEYIHPAIMCCQHLKAIRLIWHEERPPEKDLYEGFQVVRDFCLRINDTETSEMRWSKGSVEQGTIEPKEWKDERKWEDSFQLEEWRWNKDARSFEYLIGEKNVSENGKRIFLGKKADSSVIVTSDRGLLEKALKRGDLFVIFPLFEVTSTFRRADGRAYLYSVIPLSMRGKNKFIFSAHFWPAEDRKDVDVEGPNGIFGEWYRYVMLNVVELYEWLFNEFLNQIHNIEMPEEVRQEIILDYVPGAPLSEWMRPGKENREEWSQVSEERFHKLMASLVERPILFSKSEWIRPTIAYWAHDDEERAVFETMGHKVFTNNFTSHLHFSKTLSEKLKDREINEAQFNNRWHEFVQVNKSESGNLIYCQDLETEETLNKEAVGYIVRFCITGKHASIGTLLKSVVPGRDGVLRKLQEYPVLPAQLELLRDVLPGSNIIHDDFASEELALVHKKEVQVCNGDQVIWLIDEMVRKNPKRFENLNQRDHVALSKALEILVEEIGWTPRDGLKDCRFIPYREGNKVSLGTLNVRKVPGGTQWISSQSTSGHVAREYQRDSIFGVQTVKVPGLTTEVEAEIKFLSLLECGDKAVEKVEGTLNLVKLMEDVPSNFVRHFLSQQHESLFMDSVLEDFLGISDKSRFVNQKKQFQEALKIYFKEEIRGETYLTRKDMAKVPCLYDEQGKWFNAGDFAQSINPALKMLGYKALHEDLKKWSPETLYALGVDPSPSCSKVVETIKELAMEKEKHRADLGNIIFWLLTSEVSIETEFENVKHLLWVPTVDGGFKCLQHVLLPSSRNRRILGDDFGGFLDSSSFRNRMTDEDVTWEKLTKRAQSIGLKDVPGLSDMLSVVEHRRKAGTAPPPELFDTLSREVGEDEHKANDLFRTRKFGYYLNGKWTDSSQIRIMDADIVPKELRSTLEILPARHHHSQYLMADGAWDTLLPEDILQPLFEKRVAPSLCIWDDLRKLASSFEEEHKKLYGGAPIYPVDELQVCPKSIICIESDEDDAFLKEGVVGKLYILGRELTNRHGEVLKKLGARGGSELSRSDILDLLRLQKDEEATLSVDRVSSVLRLIRKIMGLDSGSRFPDESLWPAEKDGQVVWMKPKDCYVKDSQLSKYFEKNLSFICVKTDGKEYQSLKKYAIESGCKAFSAFLKKGDGIKVESYEEDSQGASFYKELANALSQYFSSLLDSVCFEWLNNVEVRCCDKIAVHYSTGELNSIVDRAATIDRLDSKWVISCDYQSPARVRDQLTEEITSTCIEQGFPDSEREKLQIILLKLLTDKVNEWAYHVEGYMASSSISQEYTIFKPTDEKSESIFIHYQTLKEVDDLNKQEMDESGYADTRSALQSWYHACQICGNRTPADESGYTTSETIKRVMCRRGGRYKGETSGFSTGNSVYLCPTHQVLWVRELVKFSELEHAQEHSERVIKGLQQRIEEFEKEASENPQKSIPWECSVFEGKSKSETGPVKGRWVERKIEFRAEHLAGFLRTMLKYLENKKKNAES
jgi:hypothetical protein